MARVKDQLRLVKGIVSGDGAYTGPFYVSVDVIYDCNLKCVCCPIHSPLLDEPRAEGLGARIMSFSLFTRLCDELSEMGTRLVILEGEGEPLLHKRIFDFVRVAKERGLRVTLFTNGTLLDEKRVEGLLESAPHELKVTLWASSREEYAQNYPADDPDNLHRVVEGLKRLARGKRERGAELPYVELCHPINRVNFESIERLAALAHEAGCDGVRFTPVHTKVEEFDRYELSAEDEESVRSKLTKLRRRLRSVPLKHNVDEVLERYRLGENVYQKYPCHAGWYYSRVRSDGTVLSCFWYPKLMGDLKKNTFAEIWNADDYREFRNTTSTQEGLLGLTPSCDCRWCSHAMDNKRVHEIRRLLPEGLARTALSAVGPAPGLAPDGK